LEQEEAMPHLNNGRH